MNENSKRIDYFDGLKGISALLVFLYHIAIIAFYEGFVGFGTPYLNNPAAAKNVILSNFVSAFYTNNCAGLCLFFVMIPVFPIIFYRKHDNDPVVLGKAAVKRYFQLLIPCFFGALINVILYWNGLEFFTSLAEKTDCGWLIPSMTPTGADNIPEFLKTMFVTIWLNSEKVPLSTLWCMYIIFQGSLAVYAVYGLLGQSKFKYLPCIVLAVISIFFPPLMYFTIGSFLTEFLFLNPERKSNTIVTVILLLSGLILAKLPVSIYPINLRAEYIYGVGAGLVIWAVADSSILKKLLSCKCFVFLGKISFEIILIHFILLSNAGCLVYQWIMNYSASPYIRLAVCFLALLPFTVLFSYLLNRFISTPANKLFKKAADKLF